MNLVIDTNVLVSGMLSQDGTPARLLWELIEARFTPIVSPVILAEYHDVMFRQKFGFNPEKVFALFEVISQAGLMVLPPVTALPLPDPKDRPFLDVALHVGCPIITGNVRHFPEHCGVEVLTPAECMQRLFTG